MKKKARIIAFYLPQFHPTPENDRFWGKGFTEWTNTAKAKPLFKGHYQPHIPADLGFYDLRMPEIREQQANLAKEAGIEGFCYWHYWFGNGKQFLQDIFDDVVSSGEPDFPFCVGWANHSWNNKNWVNTPSKEKDFYIAKQTYPGQEDHIAHFYSLLKAFKDPRYIKVDGKLLFLVYDSLGLPDSQNFFSLWNTLARKEGLNGFHFVGKIENGFYSFRHYKDKSKSFFKESSVLLSYVFEKGYDAVNTRGYDLASIRYYPEIISRFRYLVGNILSLFMNIDLLKKYDYKKISKLLFTDDDKKENVYPTIIPNWDRSPRAGKSAVIWHDSRPEYFKEQVEMAINLVKDKQPEHKLIFLMSWNEWGEGNYMEPDLKYGHGYINALKEAVLEDNEQA